MYLLAKHPPSEGFPWPSGRAAPIWETAALGGCKIRKEMKNWDAVGAPLRAAESGASAAI